LLDAIIVMAGRGVRSNMRVNKVFYKIHGKYVFLHAFDTISNNLNINKVILVVSPIDELRVKKIMNSYDSNKYEITKGGNSRQESVYNGLQKVSTKEVIIHDGARPFVSAESISSIIENIQLHGVATLALKAVDTFKLVQDMTIVDSIDRENLYSMQTPQGGVTEWFLEAHEKAKKTNFVATDDITLIQKFTKKKIKVVEGNLENIKITTPQDFKIAKAISNGRKK